MFFKLPDLGEGLQEAEVLQWHIAEGETVEADQVLVSVETAKAIVDIPAPKAGVIAKIIVQTGEMAHIGEPLLAYQSEQSNYAQDGDSSATVVGQLPTETSAAAAADHFIIGAAPHEQATDTASKHQTKQSSTSPIGNRLQGPRRTMAKAMAASRGSVAMATLCDDANLSTWANNNCDNSSASNDVSARLCRALASACQQQPQLNAHFDGDSLTRRIFAEVHLGIAVDSDDGLFVPVIRHLERLSLVDIRRQLDQLKRSVVERSIKPADMRGATIALSNFGAVSQGLKGGRYGTPIVVPPQVAILGVGRISEQPAVVSGNLTVTKQLPLSLSFDHRCVTGAEAARFLAALIVDLENSE